MKRNDLNLIAEAYQDMTNPAQAHIKKAINNWLRANEEGEVNVGDLAESLCYILDKFGKDAIDDIELAYESLYDDLTSEEIEELTKDVAAHYRSMTK